jgi:hypothetical protein
MLLRRLIILLAVAVSALIAATSASANADTEKIPFDIVLAPEDACGEAIHLSGTLLAMFTFTATPGGNIETGFHFNPQGITGVGLTSGATYHATGETLGTTTEKAKGGISDTFVNNFKIIGEGSAQNFLETDVIHLTVNANGVVTATVEKSMIRCV